MRVTINSNKGFSLIEVMTSLVLGLVVLLMVVQLFVNTKDNHVQNDRIASTLENGRYALRVLATDLKEAGFMGGVLDPSTISIDTTLVAPATECGKTGEAWAYDLTTYRALQFDNAPNANTNHVCVNATNLAKDSDILAVKRVYNQPLDPTAATFPLTANTIYLRSDYSAACLWYYDGAQKTPTGGNCPATGVYDWKYLANVYYIKNNNGVPTLCRESLGGSATGPDMSELCLAEGIEQFHVMFGMDTDNPQDGVANEFVSDPATSTGLTNWSTRVVSARIYVLARAKNPDKTFSNSKVYTMGDRVVDYSTNSDKYYRRLYSTTVLLRNPVYAAAFE